jgi:repressor LexA
MAKGRLTQRQNEAYEFIRDYMDANRKPPTLVEVGEALGISSTNGVYKLLQALEAKGYIEREKHAARGIELVEEESDPFGFGSDGPPRLPVISPTPSDEPERLREAPRGTLRIDPRLLRKAASPDRCLVAPAGDDGMNGAGIHKGDLLVIEERAWEDIENGAVTAVLVEDRLLVREFHFANDRIHLRPADRHYTEETFPPAHPGCYVVGRVIGLFRSV